MSNYKSTEVFTYLDDMYYFLSGDLGEFHKLCLEAEKKEQARNAALNALSRGSMHGESKPTQSVSPISIANPTRPIDSDETYYDQLEQNKNEEFRLTIPITLSLFAIIDCIGFLSGTNEDPLNTNENFRQFFKQSSIPVTTNDSDFVNKIFRQGLTHVYFPKLNLAVSYHSSNPSDKLIFCDDYGYLVLNINKLEEIVISTFKVIKDNSNLYPEMERKYQLLLVKYKSAHGTDIANMKSKFKLSTY